ncbi:MAG: hypothetical protein IT204_03635 [Fimbriimonadaceae bacterium]|nr:hypothetical protein [Fimbriimonadaceae bacterium]
MSTISFMPDYNDACERHWSDGQTLHRLTRLANADHLYGLAAECGLKAVMKELGMPINKLTGKPAVALHVDKLWVQFVTFANANGGATYASLLPGSNPFDDWKVDQRYADQSQYDATILTKHKAGVEKVRRILAQAQMDGIVR